MALARADAVHAIWIHDEQRESEEDLYATKFSFGSFLYEAFVHHFIPFSTLVVPLVEGIPGLRNKQLWGLRGGRLFGIPGMICLGQYAMSITFWTMIYVAVQYPNALSSSIDLFVACAFFVLRNCLVACKAGYRSDTTRALRSRSVLPDSLKRAEELIPMWLRLHPRAIVREVDAAAQKLSQPLSAQVVAMCSAAHAEASLAGAIALLGEGEAPGITSALNGQACVVPLRLLVLQVIATTSTHGNLRSIALFEALRFSYALIHAVAPMGLRALAPSTAPALTPAALAVQYCAMFVSFMIAYNFLVPYYLAVVADYRRRQRWLRAMMALFDPRQSWHSQHLHPPGFHLNLCLTPNIVQVRPMWSWLRTVGFQFQVRVQVFVTLVLAVTLSLATKLLLDAYHRSDMSADVVLGLVNVATCTISILLVLGYGIHANSVLLSLRGLINRHKLEMRQRQTAACTTWTASHTVAGGSSSSSTPPAAAAGDGDGHGMRRHGSTMSRRRKRKQASKEGKARSRTTQLVVTAASIARPSVAASASQHQEAARAARQKHRFSARGSNAGSKRHVSLGARLAARLHGTQGDTEAADCASPPSVVRLRSSASVPAAGDAATTGTVDELSSPTFSADSAAAAARRPASPSPVFALSADEVASAQQAMADVTAWALLEEQLNPVQLAGIPLGTWILRGAAVGAATWAIVVVRQLGLVEKLAAGAN